MNTFFICLIVYLVIEALVAFAFSVVAQLFYKRTGLDFRSIIKGIIERLFLTIALINQYSQALTFFSALKLATRLKHTEVKDDENKFNDYYLVGNLISVSLSIGYVHLYNHLPSLLDKIHL